MSQMLGDEVISRAFTCAATAHPSWRPTQSEIDKINAPVLFMPARGDLDAYREGGSYFNSVKARSPTSETVDFAHVHHGFVTRGDVDGDEAVREAVETALNKALQFFDQHMQDTS